MQSWRQWQQPGVTNGKSSSWYKVATAQQGAHGTGESLRLGSEQLGENNKRWGPMRGCCSWTPAVLPISASGSTAGVSEQQPEKVKIQLEKNPTDLRDRIWEIPTDAQRYFGIGREAKAQVGGPKQSTEKGKVSLHCGVEVGWRSGGWG